LRIAQIAPLWASVPPATYGGIELRLHWLTEELVARGHEVTLFASGDSQTSAKLRAGCDYNLMDAMANGAVHQYENYANANVVAALRESDTFDVIHCHTGCSHIPLSILSKTPMLHTMPIMLSVDERWLLSRYPDVPVVAISHAQLASIPDDRRQHIRVVYHGCDFDIYDLETQPGDYLAFLGRMGPRKSPLDAIRIAKEVGMPLVLAGRPQDAAEKRYFSEHVMPLIDGEQITYIGPVNHVQKNVLLKNARALIFPIQWEEPFGLVMIEAMACGTPVVACNRGSVSEVIDFGKTGYYADTADALIPLVPQALSLNRRAVREQAMARFSHKRMVDEYLQVYTSLIEQRGCEISGSING
jgi:glycosyltransferase involved in cell wall biosynthesis